jgi:hypothetical protein
LSGYRHAVLLCREHPSTMLYLSPGGSNEFPSTYARIFLSVLCFPGWFRVYMRVEQSCKVTGFLPALVTSVSCSSTLFPPIFGLTLISQTYLFTVTLSRSPLSCLINQTVKSHSSSVFHWGSRGIRVPWQAHVLGLPAHTLKVSHW